MPLEDQLSVASWLSRLPHTSPPCPTSTPPPQSPTLPATGTGKLHGVKRKAFHDPSSRASNKKPRSTQRLTRHALCAITANVSKSKQNVAKLGSFTPVESMPLPSTPHKPQSPFDHQAQSSQAELDELEAATTATLSSTIISTEGRKQTKNARSIRASLEANGMWYNTAGRLESYPAFKDSIMGIIDSQRGSSLRAESYKVIQEDMEENELSNEATYFHCLVEQVIKTGRSVNSGSKTANGTTHWNWKRFKDDGMSEPQKDQKMARGFLPGQLTDTAKVDIGLTDPKPDWVFGMTMTTKFAAGQAPPPEVRDLLELGFGLWHAFFVIEGKGNQQPITVARNQALRDGSALVNARRAFNTLAHDTGFKDPLGPDYDSFCFSCTWDINIAELWVHWYELENTASPGIFHMHLLGRYVMVGRMTEVAKFRHDVHNILDWGIFTNAPKRIETMAKVKAKEAAQVPVPNSRGSPQKRQESPRKGRVSPTKRERNPRNIKKTEEQE